ncbi:MAG TPA: hypothetical protein V6C57_05640 [Coleofasciculaceae cyanobacterium]
MSALLPKVRVTCCCWLSRLAELQSSDRLEGERDAQACQMPHSGRWIEAILD